MTKQKSTEVDSAALPWETAFAKSLALARLDAKMSQTELARRATDAGLPLFQQQIQRIENLSRPVRLNEAMVLARILQGDPWDMAAQMVDDKTAYELLQSALQAAEAAAVQTITALKDEWVRLEAALEESGRRFDQYDQYRRTRPAGGHNKTLDVMRGQFDRLTATTKVLEDALEQVTDDNLEPRLTGARKDA